ncbi:MAG: tetratricopeptide repeat protein [Vampirovibrionales bacterium]
MSFFDADKRLLLLPWSSNIHSERITQIEQLMLFCQNLYLSLCVDASKNHIKNLVPLLENLWPKLTESKRKKQREEPDLYEDITQIHKGRFLLTGHLQFILDTTQEASTPTSPKVFAIQFSPMLYDIEHQEWVLSYTETIHYFEPNHNTLDTLAPTLWSIEDVFKRLSQHVLAFINPKESIERLTDVSTFRFQSTSEALMLIATAESMSNSEQRLAFYEQHKATFQHCVLFNLYYGRTLRSRRLYDVSINAMSKCLPCGTLPMRLKAQIMNDMGSCLSLLGKSLEALDMWLQVIEADPSFVLAYMNIAHAYEELGQEEDAEKYLRKVLTLAPGDSRVYYPLARIYSCLGKWDLALTQYQLQLLIEPNDPWGHNNIAITCVQSGRIEDALLHLKRAIALDPDGEPGEYAQLILSGLESKWVGK